MLYKEVVNKFTKAGVLFKFRQVLDQLRENRSPISRNVEYNQQTDVQIERLREAIMLNFHANQSLKDFHYIKKDMDPFMDIFKKTPIKDDAKGQEELLARLVLALHLSKACLATHVEIEKTFRVIGTVELLTKDDKDFMYENMCSNSDLEIIFSSLMRNNLIQSIPTRIVFEISNNNKWTCKQYNFANTKLAFVKAHYYLNGFSGKNTIYVNSIALEKLYMLPSSISIEEKRTIFKLNFIRLIVHELINVVLRFVMGDLNSSTPTVLYIAEELLLGQRIDFIKTSNLDHFSENSGKYLKMLLETIERGECTLDQLKKMHDNSLTVLCTDEILDVGLDYNVTFFSSENTSFKYE